jgi:ribosomal protein S18 acetylase RimI-like enzyme
MSWPLYDPKALTVQQHHGKTFVTYGTDRRREKTHFDLEIDNGTCYLLGISIDKEHRGKGLGKQLYRIIETIAAELGCRVVEMTPSGSTVTGESRAAYVARLGYELNGMIARKRLEACCV